MFCCDSQLGDIPYYGPPAPGQTYQEFDARMQLPIAAGGAAIGAIVAGPIGAIVGGVGSWLMTSSRHQNKPKVQGG